MLERVKPAILRRRFGTKPDLQKREGVWEEVRSPEAGGLRRASL